MITVDDTPMEWEEEMTLSSLIEALGEDVAVVRLNGKLVSSPNFKATKIPDGSQIRLLPLVAGG